MFPLHLHNLSIYYRGRRMDRATERIWWVMITRTGAKPVSLHWSWVVHHCAAVPLMRMVGKVVWDYTPLWVSCWPDILLAVKSILHSGYLQEPCLGSLLLEELSLISTALLSSQNSRLLWRGSGFKSFCFCFCTFLKVNHHPLLNLNPHLPPVANKCKVQWPDHGSRFYSEFLDRDQPCLGCLETLN